MWGLLLILAGVLAALGIYADLTGPQWSGILTSMSAANGLTIIPETVEYTEPGAEIDVMMLDWEHAP